ncbi:adenosine receptor A2b-like [Xyrauchen texanus]|uniref:adenosine receptor A2b-like n=1 Tax=Xyrauchen texanus TaxID=154827 RepID=UPI002241E62B|nr:adenosine receptor A2b-like [Xyrauchen texanus]
MLSNAFDVVYMILELLIALFSVLGNVLVCWAVGLNSNLRTITNFFVVSLAVADIAVGVLAIPFSIVISTGFCANFYGCLFIACFVLVLTQSSIFSLLAIAIDRYIAIKIPLRYNSLVTGQRAKGVIAFCWVLSVIIGLTPMLGWHNARSGEPLNSTCPPGMMKCLFEEVVVMDYMVYFNFFACVLLPLLIMLAIYLRIFMATRHQLKCIESKAMPCELKSRSILQKEVQAAKSLAIIVGLFAVCWLPLHIINCFTLFCPECQRPPVIIMYLAIILSHANSVVNPLIYAYRIREFRYTFRKIVRYHILGRRELLSSNGSTHTSARASMADSLRIKVNGLIRDPYTEQSSTTSSCESAEPGHTHRNIATENSILDNKPVELTSSHRHRSDSTLRLPESPLTWNDQVNTCREHAVFEIKNGKDLSSPLHIKSFLCQQTDHCSELTEVS